MDFSHILRTRIFFMPTSNTGDHMATLIPGDNAYWQRAVATILLVFSMIGLSTPATAQSDIRATLHNLSKTFKGGTDPRTVKATTETQVCVFCHTPHNANTALKGPLWNRTQSATYTRYTSSSLDAESPAIANGFNAQPGGSSLLCLSCHDGVIALGNVNVLPRNTGTPVSATSITLSGSITTMPAGAGATSGYTRLIGTNLTNDHPISISFTRELANADGELRLLDAADQSFTAASATVIGVRSSGFKPLLPLEPTGKNGQGQVQCATCHDPHITKEKFLRLNRYQTAAPSTNGFDANNDQICLACHPKLAPTWAESAHALSSVADETYATAAATLRNFTGTKKVWEVACLNCHDTHTVQGSRRLLREGVGTSTTTTGTGAGSYQPGSTNPLLDKVSAIETTCYQCHQSSATRILSGTATGTVPDIRTEFERPIRMPIDTFSQRSAGTSNTNTSENHDIRNANFIECRKLLGNTAGSELDGDHLTDAQKATCNSMQGSNDKRHVECTDCHNPHRVRRNSKFYGTSTDGNKDKRTHDVGGPLGNVASGVLRGAWGVEPIYDPATPLSSTYTTPGSWTQLPNSYQIKKGDPTGTGYDRAVNVSYLTREYQLCFKCHSDYAIGSKDTSTTDFPLLGNTRGGTAYKTNEVVRYTNIAAEFGSVNATDPAETNRDQGEVGETTIAGNEDGTALEPTAVNHRSWHPVMWPTGRTRDERRMASTGGNFRTPFAANVGTQTMHCSDCHGYSGSWTKDTGPDTTKTQGPHGSSNSFLLKGDWSTSVQVGGSSGVCFNCHNPGASSGTGDDTARVSGFNNDGADGGGGHANEHDSRPCMRCHIAVPHGWKNKAFLVNLNCVGKEGGQASDCVSVSTPFSYSPYYNDARLRVGTWRASGNWTQSSCGGKDWMDKNCG
jgi:hypothetical protein